MAAQWTGTYSGPTDAATLNADTAFDISGFLNPVAGTLGWSIDPAGHTLSLVYTPTPVPEPGTLALAGLAAAGMVWRRRAGSLPAKKLGAEAPGLPTSNLLDRTQNNTE